MPLILSQICLSQHPHPNKTPLKSSSHFSLLTSLAQLIFISTTTTTSPSPSSPQSTILLTQPPIFATSPPSVHIKMGSTGESQPSGLISGIAHINLIVQAGDLPAAHQFYGATMGLTSVPVPKSMEGKLAWWVSSQLCIHVLFCSLQCPLIAEA